MSKPSGAGMETEVKFVLSDPQSFLEKGKQAGAVCTQERVFERNLRFDTPDGRLRAAHQVLRLRQDTRARMTFKGPAQENAPVAIRPEIEFTVSDFDAAQSFLEALGYEISVIYEKYRTSFDLEGAEVSLDEMPFGTFCEIEGRDADQIKELSGRLGLHWDDRINESYLALFERVKARRNLNMRDLTFDAFRGMGILPQDFLAEA